MGYVGTIILWFVLAFVGQALDHIGLTLGHFNVVDFSAMQRVRKNHHKYQGNYNCCATLLLVFACFGSSFSVVFVSFFWGMLHLGCGCSFGSVGLIFLPMLCASGMLGPRWHHIGLMLSHFGAILWFVYVEPSWAILGSVSAFVLDLGISVSLNFRPCTMSLQKTPYIPRKQTQFLGCDADGFCCYFLVVFVSFFWGMHT